MTRRFARECALQFLFQLDINPDDCDVALARFWKERGINANQSRFPDNLVHGVLEHKESIDAKIRRYAEHWDVNRIAVVDRNILRLALFEMFFCPDIPPVVSINEAVDLGKRFGCNDSGRFVNGILDRAIKDVSRPAREPVVNDLSW